MKNENDDECFKWCITRAKNPVTTNHPERITKLLREQSEQFNWEGITFPMKLEDISKFENRNPGIFINVFGIENKKIYVLKCGSSEDGKDTINLLYYGEGDNKHFSLIKNMSRLLAKQTTKHTGGMFYCMRCLSHFQSQDKLNKHLEYCIRKEPIATLPPKETHLEFKNYSRKIKHPIIIYADFECFTQPIDSCQPSTQKSFTEKYQKHTPSGFCIYPVCAKGIDFHHEPIIVTLESEMKI